MNQAKLLMVLGLPLLLAGCGGGLTETLGLGRSMPDAFAVVDRPPLSLPPDYTLRPPEPGKPRPQEINMTQRASQILLGADQPKAQGRSAGEESLLNAAGSAQADPHIRDVVDREEAQRVVASKTLIDSLLVWRNNQPPAATVDAAAERERIQKAKADGAPVNQGATPVIEKQKRFFLGL